MPDGMPTWEEWNEQMTKEQRDYSLYKILQSMDTKLAKQPKICGKLFASKKDVFWLIWGIRTIYGSGILILVIWIIGSIIF